MRSGPLHRVALSLSRRLVRRYPNAWRDRYEEEVLALLDDSPARLRDIVDLTRGLLVERARAFFEPGDRPVVLAILVCGEGMARGLAVLSVPAVLGWAARWSFGPAPQVNLILSLFQIVVMTMFIVGVVRSSSSRAIFEPPRPLFANRAAHACVGILWIAMFLASWSMPPARAWLDLWMYVAVAGHQMSNPRPWQVQMAHAVQQLRAARHEMKWALMELARCERLAGDRALISLERAREAVARITREQDQALAILHGLGYRATLRNGRPTLEHPDQEPNLNTN